jgi:hypothetical protein
MNKTSQDYFSRFKEKYPRLFNLTKRIVIPLSYERGDCWGRIYPSLSPKIAQQYNGNLFLRLPYTLLDPAYRSRVKRLSLANGYCIFATDLVNSSVPQVFSNKKWIPHGAFESCIYSIVSRCDYNKNKYEALFVIYGTMKTLTVAIVSIIIDDRAEIVSFESDPELTIISGGFMKRDILQRCLTSFVKMQSYTPDSVSSMNNNLTLAAMREPNFGHHQWNIFSSLVDIIQYLYESGYKGQEQFRSLTLAYDPHTNYLALDEVARFYNIASVRNQDYCFLSHGPLIPLDAPIPRHRSRFIFDYVFPQEEKSSDGECIMVIIKGFNPHHNQNQIDRVLATLILLNVVKYLLDAQDADIVVDGVTRTSSDNSSIEGNEAFRRFRDEEEEMYRELTLSLSRQSRIRVKSTIGMTTRIKYSSYIRSKFSVSISAHSTLGLSLIAGKPVVDIITKGLLRNTIKTSIYNQATDLVPDGLSFIDFDENDSGENIVRHIITSLNVYLNDRASFLIKNSFTSHYNKELNQGLPNANFT